MRELETILNNGKLTINKVATLENGDVQIRCYYNDPVNQKRYWCKFTSAMGWEHAAVSGRNHKIPEWEIMCRVKDIFWDEEECCIEFHPRKSQYVNNDECLHIWKPIGVELPEPDTILVGIQGMDQEETKKNIDFALSLMTDEEKMQMAENIGIHIGNRAMKRLKK